MLTQQAQHLEGHGKNSASLKPGYIVNYQASLAYIVSAGSARLDSEHRACRSYTVSAWPAWAKQCNSVSKQTKKWGWFVSFCRT